MCFKGGDNCTIFINLMATVLPRYSDARWCCTFLDLSLDVVLYQEDG